MDNPTQTSRPFYTHKPLIVDVVIEKFDYEFVEDYKEGTVSGSSSDSEINEYTVDIAVDTVKAWLLSTIIWGAHNGYSVTVEPSNKKQPTFFPKQKMQKNVGGR